MFDRVGIPAKTEADQFLAASGEGLSALQRIGSRAQRGEQLSEAEVREVGKKFESLMLHQMLSLMRKSIPKNELFGESHATEMYRDMFDQQIAETVASSGQSGIGESIVQEILRQQQQKTQAPPPGDSPFRSLAEPETPLRPIEKSVEFKPIPRDEVVFRPIPRPEDEKLRPIR
jgi:flagellar protein FlgJ